MIQLWESFLKDVCSPSTVGCFFFHTESPLNRGPCHREQSQACGYCKNPAMSQQNRSLSRNWAPVSPRLHFSERFQCPTHVQVGDFRPLWSLWKPCHEISKEGSRFAFLLQLCSNCQTWCLAFVVGQHFWCSCLTKMIWDAHWVEGPHAAVARIFNQPLLPLKNLDWPLFFWTYIQ